MELEFLGMLAQKCIEYEATLLGTVYNPKSMMEIPDLQCDSQSV